MPHKINMIRKGKIMNFDMTTSGISFFLWALLVYGVKRNPGNHNETMLRDQSKSTKGESS